MHKIMSLCFISESVLIIILFPFISHGVVNYFPRLQGMDVADAIFSSI